MRAGEGLDSLGTDMREPQADDTLIIAIAHPLYEPGAHCSVDEFDSTVVAQQQVFGDFANRRCRTVAANRQQELMLRSG